MFSVMYIDDILTPEGFATEGEAISYVAEQYRKWDLGENPPFPFQLYWIVEDLKVDLQRALTTNKRGTFPKTYAVEGNNFVD